MFTVKLLSSRKYCPLGTRDIAVVLDAGDCAPKARQARFDLLTNPGSIRTLRGPRIETTEPMDERADRSLERFSSGMVRTTLSSASMKHMCEVGEEPCNTFYPQLEYHVPTLQSYALPSFLIRRMPKSITFEKQPLTLLAKFLEVTVQCENPYFL